MAIIMVGRAPFLSVAVTGFCKARPKTLNVKQFSRASAHSGFDSDRQQTTLIYVSHRKEKERKKDPTMMFHILCHRERKRQRNDVIFSIPYYPFLLDRAYSRNLLGGLFPSTFHLPPERTV
jgi:hypothetical protein